MPPICYTIYNIKRKGEKMIPLSRREEQVLLAVWALKDNAYLVSIKKYLTKLTKIEWSIGPVQKPLLQLEKKGYITTYMGTSLAIRGGRRKKMCRITKEGIKALQMLKKEQDLLWKKFIEVEIH
jgi:DNA-binding PadR family transcriptional regulator